MRSKVCLQDKIKALRRLETYAYQVAYYILQDEKLAAQAAMAGLLELSKNDGFFETPHHAQRQAAKKTIMKKAMEAAVRSMRDQAV